MLLTKNTQLSIFNKLVICYNDHTIPLVTPLVLLLLQYHIKQGRLFLSRHDMVIISVNLWSGNTVSFRAFYFSANRMSNGAGFRKSRICKKAWCNIFLTGGLPFPKQCFRCLGKRCAS